MSLSALLAPISLPLASLFALPMFSSWSTSVNLLFFSLTWTTLATVHTPLQLEFFGPLLIRLALFLLPSFLFLLFDILVPSLAVELKAQGERGLPGGQGRKKTRIRSVALWSCFNVLLAVCMQAGLEWLVTEVLHLRSLLVIKGSKWSLNHVPNPWKLAQHLVLGLVARNVLQYYAHRGLLHSPSGGLLARLHQSWHHSITHPYSLTAAYDHPLCHLVHRFVPLYIPAIALRMHILTYLLLLALVSLEHLFTYSGYSVLPSTIMLRGMARRVDAHMMTRGKGNFGPVGVLDWVHGTTVGRGLVEDLGDEMDKHHVQERTGGVVESVKGRGKKGKGKN